MLKHYSNTAVEASLVAGINDTVGSCQVSSTTGFPSLTPFTVVFDPDTPNEEVCLVTLVVGTTLNITRGYDGTTALPHSAGSLVKHAAIAEDFRDANEHTFGVAAHGTTSPVVGEDDAQTLTNKTISGIDNTITDIPMSSVAGLDDALDLKAPLASPTFTGTVGLPSTTSIGDVSATEIGHLDGSTSNIQDQIDAIDANLDAKAPLANPTFTGNVTLPSTTSIGNVTAAEIAALDGVTSQLQAQINAITGGSFAVLPPGGTTGQVLTKLSNADFDVAWQTLAIVGNGAAADAIYAEDAFSGGTKSTYTDPISGYVYEVRTFNYTTGAATSVTNSSGVIGKLLVVAGGGGGGSGALSWPGGGGGAGAAWYGDYAFGAGQHNLLVGAGGAGGGGTGATGQNSTFDDIICYGGGGGGGGGSNGADVPGASGGCGGGGRAPSAAGGTGTGGTGSALTNFLYSNGNTAGGGTTAGSGGSTGLTSDISGTSTIYGVGGSGGSSGSAGASNTAPGSGGGGGGFTGGGGTAGKNGIIIIRYRIA